MIEKKSNKMVLFLKIILRNDLYALPIFNKQRFIIFKLKIIKFKVSQKTSAFNSPAYFRKNGFIPFFGTMIYSFFSEVLIIFQNAKPNHIPDLKIKKIKFIFHIFNNSFIDSITKSSGSLLNEIIRNKLDFFRQILILHAKFKTTLIRRKNTYIVC